MRSRSRPARRPGPVFACAALAESGLPFPVLAPAEAGETTEADVRTLEWDALAELADRGVEIGSHTVSHPYLTQLADSELDRELRESRERLEHQLGRRCRFVAYPYGDHDERVRAAARAAGYEAAFALPGRARPFDRLESRASGSGGRTVLDRPAQDVRRATADRSPATVGLRGTG